MTSSDIGKGKCADRLPRTGGASSAARPAERPLTQAFRDALQTRPTHEGALDSMQGRPNAPDYRRLLRMAFTTFTSGSFTNAAYSGDSTP